VIEESLATDMPPMPPPPAFEAADNNDSDGPEDDLPF